MESVKNISKKLKESDKKFRDIFENKSFTVITDDETEIKFMITKLNLPHLLGIKSYHYNKTASSYKNMYHFFWNIIMYPQYYQNKINTGEFSFRDIFARSINYKINTFNDIKINKDSLCFIIKFDPFLVSELYQSKCDYFLFIKNDIDYSGALIGFRQVNENVWTPTSLLGVKDLESLKYLVQDQTVIAIKSFSIKNILYNTSKKYELNSKELEKRKESLETEFYLKRFEEEKYFEPENSIEILRKKSHEIAILKERLENLEEKNDNIKQKLEETTKLYSEILHKNKILQDNLNYINKHPVKYAVSKILKRK